MVIDMKQEYLGGNITLFCSDRHKFGTDALLLAHFAAPKTNDVACDLGTGCGIIPLLWCRTSVPKEITAVDIQSDAIELVEKAIEYNALQNKLNAVCADLKGLKNLVPFNYFTLVTMNPPYKANNAGLKSEDDGVNLAHFESACTALDIAVCAGKLLKPSGRLVLCQRPERLVDVITAMSGAKIEPKRLQLVCQRKGIAPSLILIEGKKGAKSGLSILPPFYIENDNGEYSVEMQEI
jgi:tRNA1(Val) A37 N6-methylase TrmN6